MVDVNEIVLEVTQEADVLTAPECLTERSSLSGHLGRMRANVREAVADFYFDGPKPLNVRAASGKDEVCHLMKLPASSGADRRALCRNVSCITGRTSGEIWSL